MNNQEAAIIPQSMDNSQPWMGAGGMLPATSMYADQNAHTQQTTAADQQLERNLAQMLSEEAGFGLSAQSTLEPVAFGGNASVAFMGNGSPVVSGSDSKAVGKADGTSNDTTEVDASVADLVEPPKKKKGGGRKRSKAA